MKHVLRAAPVAIFASALQAASPDIPSLSHVPLCPGLTIVTAISQPRGDYESIKRIESVTPDAVRLRYSSYMPDPKDDGESTTTPPLPWIPFTVYRTIRGGDLESGVSYLQLFGPPGSIPETVNGSTALGPSRKILRDLRTGTAARLTIFQTILPTQPLKEDGSTGFFGTEYRLPGEIARVDPPHVLVPVLVNDVPTNLAAMHARGKFLWDEGDFLFLDDDANPLSLQFTIGNAAHPKRDNLRVIKVNFACADDGRPAAGDGTEAVLERALIERGRVDVFSIYFDFNRDVIREESQPTLSAIASILKKHPDWRLAVEGHTDNIGGANFNLDLSTRRSVAVKEALVRTLGIDGARLTTSGYGATRPKDTNDTLEGRARNRRVELVRS